MHYDNSKINLKFEKGIDDHNYTLLIGFESCKNYIKRFTERSRILQEHLEFRYEIKRI